MQDGAIAVILVYLLLTLNIFHTFFSVSVVNFEHVIASCVRFTQILQLKEKRSFEKS